MFGSLAKPTPPASPAQPATQPQVKTAATANPSSQPPSTSTPAVPNPCPIHQQTALSQNGTPSISQELVKSLGPIKNWTDVFNLTPEKRRQWFDVVPGAEAAYTKILENARKKHALAMAEKAKVQAGVAPTAAGQYQNGAGQLQNVAGPSRAPLPAFTSPAFFTDPPRAASAPIPSSTPKSSVPASSQQPPSQSNPPRTLEEQVAILKAENADMRSIMLKFKKATLEKSSAILMDARARSERHLGNADNSAQSADAVKHSQELDNLHGALNRLSAETSKIKQENENHLVELNAIRSDVKNLRKENTRLGLASFKETALRETLEGDKAKLEAEVERLKQSLQQKDAKLAEAESEAKHYKKEFEAWAPIVKKLSDSLRETEEERRKFKIRLDAVKLLVLQDDLDGLIPDLDPPASVKRVAKALDGPHAQTKTLDATLPSFEEDLSSTGTAVDTLSAASSGPAWSKGIKERARSQGSMKLLKVAWKLAAMERVALPTSSGPTSSASAKKDSILPSIAASKKQKQKQAGGTSERKGDKHLSERANGKPLKAADALREASQAFQSDNAAAKTSPDGQVTAEKGLAINSSNAAAKVNGLPTTSTSHAHQTVSTS